MGDEAATEEWLEKAKRADVDSSRVYLTETAILMDQGKLDEAFLPASKAFGLEPGNPNAAFTLGNLFVEMDNAAAALPFFLLACDIDKYWIAPRISAGNAADEMGNRKAAIQHWKKAKSMAPGQQLKDELGRKIRGLEVH